MKRGKDEVDNMEYPEYPIDNRIIFKAELPKEKVLKFKGVLHSNLPYYSENSIRHPAKMSVLLTRWILQRFTREGETVIDPMSGISTTLLEAVNMNRNCVAVEFEKKFVDWTNENIKLLNKNKPLDRRGKGVVLQGDARDLANILNKQADKIVFSPPYCKTEAFHDQDFTLRSTKVNPTSRKISEQKYGKDADVIVMSPPFASSPRAGNKDKDEFWKDQEQRYNRKFIKTRKILNSMHYSDNPDNIGNLLKGDIDAVVTSPPYAGKEKGIGDWKTPRDDFQKWVIDQLKTKGYIEWRGKRYTEKEWRAMNHGRLDGRTTKGVHKQPTTGYSMDPNNIGNLPKGEISAIITSPPYAESVSAKGEPKKRAERMKKAGHDPKTIIGRKARCGEIDWQYSEDKDNLGNLKKKSYLSEMKKVYGQCFSVLKQGGLAILITKNFVRNYKQVRLDIDTILLMESCGFKLIDRYFRAIDKPSFWILNYRKQCKKKDIPDPTAHFEDVLIFRKVMGGLTHGE